MVNWWQVFGFCCFVVKYQIIHAKSFSNIKIRILKACNKKREEMRVLVAGALRSSSVCMVNT